MWNRNANRETERAQEHGHADGHEQEEIMAVGHDAVGMRGEAALLKADDEKMLCQMAWNGSSSSQGNEESAHAQ